MSRRACAVIAILTASCGKGGDTAVAPAGSAAGAAATAAATQVAPAGDAATPGAPAAELPACAPLPFAASTPVPEVSGAAWLAIDGKLALVVVADSGNRGAYGILDPESGATIETGTLPLSSEASDDIEGVAAREDKLYGVTSSGWIRVWQRRDRRFKLVGTPYPLGPVDLPDTKRNNRPPPGDGMVCDGRVINCGRNYEGLCLAPTPRGDACIGFAASKADGHLYCVTDDAGRLVVHHDRAIAVAPPGTLSDCAFGDDGTLWAGSNLFDLGHVYRVAHWEDPVHATVERVGALVIGSPEAIAARGDVVYRMSDLGVAPSLMGKFRCPR